MQAKVLIEVRVDSNDDMLAFCSQYIKNYYVPISLFIRAYQDLLTPPTYVLLWDDKTVTWGTEPLCIDEVKADNFKQITFIKQN